MCPDVSGPEGALRSSENAVFETIYVFPIIARVIEQAYRYHHRFITAQEISARLLLDIEERNLVEAGREQQQAKQSVEWLATNMVS